MSIKLNEINCTVAIAVLFTVQAQNVSVFAKNGLIMSETAKEAQNDNFIYHAIVNICEHTSL
jgi:hypothetical protein